MASAVVQVIGGRVIVDESDVALVKSRPWRVFERASGVVYVKYSRTLLHRLLIGAPKGSIVDHANGDGTDNRRENLRICSHTQNMQNRKRNTERRLSKFKGVTQDRRRLSHPYQAAIEAFGTRVYLGCFATEEAAAKAYDRAALIFHGKFARTNGALGLL